MNDIEVRIAFWTLIISSVINLITISCNIYWNSVGKKEKKRLENYINIRDTIIRYYLPIKYSLLQLELCQLRIEERNKEFDIFSLYSTDSELRSFRVEVLNEYRKYLEVYNKLEMRYANPTIDKYLDRVYTHIHFILCVDDQKTLNRYKEKYKMPYLSEIIDEIDRYASNNKVF